MRAELTAFVRRSQDGFVASCAEVPGTEVEAATEEEALESLAEAVSVIFEVNRNEAMRDVGGEFKPSRISVTLEDFDRTRLLQVDEEEVAISSDF